MQEKDRLPCEGLSEWFFPLPGEGLNGGRSRRLVAKWLCSGCPARVACQQWGARIEQAADKDESPRGIWGGLERRQLLNLPLV